MRAMKCVLAVGVALLVMASSVLAQADDSEVEERVSVTFYHTGDIHEGGAQLPRIAGFVESRKADDPDVLFVDSGDWFNNGDLTKLGTRGEAIAAMLGASGYDAMVFGNHEYSFGTQRLAELMDRFALPVVAANVIWPEDLQPEQAVPYRILELEEVTVAIIGAATSFIGPAYAMQEADELLEVLPAEESIGDIVAKLEERADIIVLLTHIGGLEDKKLAQAVPGVDIIFGGHSHYAFRSLVIADGTDTIVQHSGQGGWYIAELTVIWDGDQIVEPELRLVDVTDELPVSVVVEEIYEQYMSQSRDA